ncbi:MAG TPA: arginine deiminase family protein [Bacillota bacterium]|jgi:N-dimethylarginine dimethylaminohydrolase
MAQYNSHGKLRRVLLCPPTYYKELPISEIAHRSMDEGDPVKIDVAKKMHEELVQALTEAGVAIEWEKAIEDHCWQVYTRDFGASTPGGPLIGKFKYEQRWGDEEAAIEAFNRIGVKVPGRVTRGAVEGGDSWQIDEHTLVIGSGNRSTLRGIENAAEIMKPFDVEVMPVEFLAKWNHLDMIFSVVADKLAIICEEGVPPTFTKWLANHGWRTIAVPLGEVLKTGCNVLALGDGKVLSFEENKIVNDMLRAEGFTLYTPHLREFTKMGGGPHCLTFEIERDR